MAQLQGHLVFLCGERRFAVPAPSASEVVTLPALTPVPGTPAHLLGVFAHRGELLPVVDLLRLAGDAEPRAWSRAVVVRAPAGPVALAATRVQGVETLEGALEPRGATGVDQHLLGPLRAPAGEVTVIELSRFVQFLHEAR